MFSRTALIVAAASAGVSFLAYCIYFDRKRRSDPDFRKKLLERRRLAKRGPGGRGDTNFPDPSNPDSFHQFFLQEIQKGEELLATGQVEEGVEHLCNAVAVCGQPQQLLGLLQQSIPPQIFQSILARLPMVTQNFRSRTVAAASNSSVEIADDVE